MPDKFDPYREALVMETITVWTDEHADWPPRERRRIEKLLHGSPQDAGRLEYQRTHTGFCRVITVTPEDIDRFS